MSEQIHKRRKRYKGTHPRSFDEKYKELNPEMYPETIEKVISKGSTPAGMHISIMVDEILEFLDIQPGQVGLDCTLGYGGHTSKMLEKLEGQGHVYGLDIDPIEIEKTTQRIRNKGFDENIFTSLLTNFRNIDEVSEKYGKFDFVLADLGVSSMQIDNPERGFSYRFDAHLDMRMNQEDKLTAEIVVNTYSYEQLRHVIYDYGEEKFASLIAREIVNSREIKPIHTTFELVDVIKKALPNKVLSKVGHPAKQTFLGIRYEVNKEKTEIEIGVDKGINFLSYGGRLAVITFNSLEDGLIKNMFKKYAVKPATDKWVPEQDIQLDYELVTRKPVAPSEREIEANLRSKPAKLRVIERKE